MSFDDVLYQTARPVWELKYQLRNVASFLTAIVLAYSGKRISKYHRRNETLLYRLIHPAAANKVADEMEYSILKRQ